MEGRPGRRRGVSIRTDDAVGGANWVARRQRATKGGRVGREGDEGGGRGSQGAETVRGSSWMERCYEHTNPWGKSETANPNKVGFLWKICSRA